ncbi:BglG family transcription antiterminator [Levilactobacillus huananensis]|uniref:BglG family transcription antiterminator n=1 Tax=Levilactobacillus huananensis TaxID=2486019 RepID=UPI000F77C92B|nr:PTS sugar transporter subunit IIA [Levilactobacillus huananensis]
MLNERSKVLLSMLCEKGAVSQNDIQELFGVSKRTIHNDLVEIDNFLLASQFAPVEKKVMTSYEISGDRTEIAQTLKLSGNSDRKEVNYWEEPNFRIGFEYSKIFWHDTRLTIDDFTKMLSVSRSTINADLKRLKRELRAHHIDIQFDKQFGLHLHGNESDFREAYFSYVRFLKQFNYDLEAISGWDRLVIVNWLREAEHLLMVEFTYDSFERMVMKVNVVLRRIRLGHAIKTNFQPELKRPKNELVKLQQISGPLEEQFKTHLTMGETSYLVAQIDTSGLIKNEVVSRGYNVQVDFLVNHFIEEVGRELGIDLSGDQELFQHLGLHFQATLTKKATHLTDLITQESFENIQSMFPREYEAVQSSLKKLENEEFASFDNTSEYAFLTLHVVSSIEKIKNQISKDLRILLICNLGVGTSQFLKYRFTMVSEAHIEIASMDQLSSKLKNVDFIISTIYLPDLKVPCLKVSPILNAIDLKNINQLEQRIIAEKIEHRANERKEWQKSPMLKDLLTENTIETNVHVNNWEEAIRHGGRIIERTGGINSTYTEAMVAAVKKFGPYIVIAPHIALAHASSKDGVNEISMSLCTLDQGINFGNKENDPVNIVICLAAIDHHSHLRALSELVTNLSDSSFMNMLMTSDREEIVQYIQNEKLKEVE